ncbi:MAG TPA: hypothetical protein PKD85_13405 [Saprospiraceae bacterium]|nr:hypothetical protein [Saprospiraceae bacterium]
MNKNTKLILFTVVSLLVIAGFLFVGNLLYKNYEVDIQSTGTNVSEWKENLSPRYNIRFMMPVDWGFKEDFSEGGLLLIKPIEGLENNYPEPHGISISIPINGMCVDTDWNDIRGGGVFEDKVFCVDNNQVNLTAPKYDYEIKNMLEKIAATFIFENRSDSSVEITPSSVINIHEEFNDKYFLLDDGLKIKWDKDIIDVSDMYLKNLVTGWSAQIYRRESLDDITTNNSQFDLIIDEPGKYQIVAYSFGRRVEIESGEFMIVEKIPIIEIITPASGPIGTKITIKGKNLAGYAGDMIAIFEREDGKKITLWDNSATDGEINVIVEESCREGEIVHGRYSGIPQECDYIEFTPGIYKVYTEPWGVKSNFVLFTLTN